MKRASLWQIFAVFAKVGAFTIGGGYAMIPIIEKELCSRNWIGEDDIPDIVAIAQTAPGVLAVNMAVFSGYRLRGIKGSIAATIGAILPSFAIILAIAAFFTQFQNNTYVARAFQGIRPAVVALIAVPMIKMARRHNHNWWSWAISIGALVGIAFLKISPVLILLVTIVVAVAISSYNNKEGGR